MPLAGVPVYVFTCGGSYLGMTSQTDAQGQVSFDLPDGDYKFRADYLGYQFWSGVSTVPTTLSDVLTIAHQDVTITVERLYQAPAEALEGVPVYLFTEAGSYLGQSLTTNAQGQVVFSLPEQSYKLRANYLGYQFWSSPYTWTNTTVTINHGLTVLHVTKGGSDVVGAPVYLFTPSGSYLGKSETKDATGIAQFMLPDQQYKFRVDYEGSQYWSDVVTIIPHEENNIELNLDLLALDLTNDPNPVRFNGVPPELEPEKVLLASLGSLTGLLGQAVILQIPGETVYYYINNHLGTPQKVVDESGTVVWSADYRPFGEVDVTVNTAQNKFRFPGQYYDQETELHYNYYRTYSPAIGRYLRGDPLRQIEPQHVVTVGRRTPAFYSLLDFHRELNPYVYARNNSLTYTDVFGLASNDCCYEYDWSGSCCVKKGPKKLNRDCFAGCVSRYFPQYAIGALAGAGMIRLGHPVLGGILFAVGAHHVYATCYLPCKECPPVRLKNF